MVPLIGLDYSPLSLLGLTLLCSIFPNRELLPRRQFLLETMRNSKNSDEDEAWSKFLTRFPIQDNQEPHWRKLLEDILAYPQHYSSEILSGAMERYQEMMKDENIDLLEQNEAELGLP